MIRKTIIGGFLSQIFLVLIAIFIILMAVAGNGSDDDSDSSITVNATGYQDLVSVAEQELSMTAGAKGGDKYSKWYLGYTDGASWCARFVSYCANQAGLIDKGIIPKYQSCDSGVSWFLNKNEFTYTEAYGGSSNGCSIGDIIFFTNKHDKNDSTHTGIVISVSDTTVTTIEGNSSNTVKKNQYQLSSNYILGYGHPEYGVAEGDGYVSEEFKYFAKYESSCNYDQGFSSGDGYYALGYYQFDSRYSLQEFLQLCYNSNSTFSMFQPFLNCSKSSLHHNKDLEKAWHQAYAINTTGFCALQDQFEYESYYEPLANKLASKGINISNRRDCIKGLICGISNLFGTSGGLKIILASDVSDDMDDLKFAETICNYIYTKYNGNGKYGTSYANRYMNELGDIKGYLS